jgi:hypothetical protein
MDERRSTDQEPGDRRAGQPTRLERPPSDRYAPEATPIRDRRAARNIVVALIGAGLIAILGGPLSMTAGLIAVSVVLGLVLGSMVRATPAAVGLAVGSVVVGLLGIWAFARLEGGVLDPLTYLADVQGVVAPAQILLAAVAALVSSR